MLTDDRCAAAEVTGELEEMRGHCEDAADLDSASFLRILKVSKGLLAQHLPFRYRFRRELEMMCVLVSSLQGILDHCILRDAEHLTGLYAKAFDRICNQVMAKP